MSALICCWANRPLSGCAATLLLVMPWRSSKIRFLLKPSATVVRAVEYRPAAHPRADTLICCAIAGNEQSRDLNSGRMLFSSHGIKAQPIVIFSHRQPALVEVI